MSIIVKTVELLGGRVATIRIEDIVSAVREISKSIHESEAKSRGRSMEDIQRSLVKGMICEFGVAQLIGERNVLAWDYQNRDTFGYDVKDAIHGYRHEVKHHVGRHWTFYPAAVKTLIKNIRANALDTIITADYTVENDVYTVRPKLVIDPSYFHLHMRISQYNGSQFYYDHVKAKRDKHCIEL